jgi:hypothetical protein
MLFLLNRGLNVTVVLLAVGIVFLLGLPKIRRRDRLISPRANMMLSLGLFLITCFAGIMAYVTEGRFHLYEVIMLAGMGGIVFVRVAKYAKNQSKPL